jgi:hypothetical protein
VRSTTTALRESSRTNVIVGCPNALAAEGPEPFDETTLMFPATTETSAVDAVSTPRTSTEPSVVVTVVAPVRSTRTVNAVPVAVVVEVGVVTA